MGQDIRKYKSISEDNVNGLRIYSRNIGFGTNKWLVCSINYGAAAADYTATVWDNCCRYVVATNASGAVNAIFAAPLGQELVVYNNSGYTLTVKAAGQTGVAVANGARAVLCGTGTDFASVGLNSTTVTSATITGSTINSSVIGVSVPAAGNFTTLGASGNVTLSPTGTVAISPSSTVTVSPTGALTVNPTAASTINNTSIGATTPLAGTFTTLQANTALQVKGTSTGVGIIATANTTAGNFTTTLPAVTDTVALLAASQTLTNKTITDPIMSGCKRITAEVDVTSSAVLVAITGLSVPLTAAGVYAVHCYVPGTSGATGGVQFALAGTGGLTATSFSGTCRVMNGTTVAANGTTTTLGNAIANVAAIFTDLVCDAVIVVNVAGNLVAQIAQSASNGTATSAYVNGYMNVTRIA